MPLKLITAHEVKPGTTIMIEGQACVAKSNDTSKTGKHGASKCRIEAVGTIDGKKGVIAVPGSERFDVPLIEKKKSQILSIAADGTMANVMDMESFENLDIVIMEDIRGTLNAGDQVEYMIIDETTKVIMRKLASSN